MNIPGSFKSPESMPKSSSILVKASPMSRLTLLLLLLLVVRLVVFDELGLNVGDDRLDDGDSALASVLIGGLGGDDGSNFTSKSLLNKIL